MRLLPIALFRSTATTELSTPPLRARSTLSFWSCSRSSATVRSIKASGDQLPPIPTMSIKLASSLVPSSLWKASGWNCTPQVSSPSMRKAAFSTSGVRAIGRKPSGSRVMVSPWLIHTVLPLVSPLRRGSSGAVSSSLAGPYSRVAPGSTIPPA